MATAAPITIEIARKVLDIVDAGLVKGVGKPKAGALCVEAAVCLALGEPHGDEPSCVDPALRAFKITLNDAEWSSTKARAAGLRRLALAQLGSKGALDTVEFVKRLALVTVNKTVPRALRAAASMKMPAQHSAALEAAAAKCEAATDLDAARAASDAARDAASDAASYAASYAARAASDAASDAASAASYAASDAARAASDAASYAASYAARAASDAASDAASYAARAASDAARDKELSDAAEAAVQILIAMGAPGCEWLALAPLTAA